MIISLLSSFQWLPPAVPLGERKQHVDIERLREAGNRPEPHRMSLGIAQRGTDDRRDGLELGVASLLLSELPTIEHGQHQIEHDQTRPEAGVEHLHRLGAVGRARGLVTSAFQNDGDGLAHVVIVFDDQDRRPFVESKAR